MKYIDENINITSSSTSLPSNLLDADDVNLFLEIAEIKPFLFFIQNNYLPLIGYLKNKKVIGLEIKDWLYKKSDLEKLMYTGGKLLNNIITRQY